MYRLSGTRKRQRSKCYIGSRKERKTVTPTPFAVTVLQAVPRLIVLQHLLGPSGFTVLQAISHRLPLLFCKLSSGSLCCKAFTILHVNMLQHLLGPFTVLQAVSRPVVDMLQCLLPPPILQCWCWQRVLHHSRPSHILQEAQSCCRLGPKKTQGH